MIVWHVISDRPMTVGQRIVFDEENRSGVWQRVMALRDAAADALAHPENYPLPLEHKLDVALRELAMEEVRQKEFPQYPSRMACLYVSEEEASARQWKDYFASLGRPVFGVAKLEVNGRCFVGDAANCFDGVTDQQQNLRLARHYWQNLPNDENRPPIRELLVDGDIRVLEIL